MSHHHFITLTSRSSFLTGLLAVACDILRASDQVTSAQNPGHRLPFSLRKGKPPVHFRQRCRGSLYWTIFSSALESQLHQFFHLYLEAGLCVTQLSFTFLFPAVFSQEAGGGGRRREFQILAYVRIMAWLATAAFHYSSEYRAWATPSLQFASLNNFPLISFRLSSGCQRLLHLPILQKFTTCWFSGLCPIL